jgi:hypothetical protein
MQRQKAYMMADPPPNDAAAVRQVRFHYIKGNFFRVVHVDGVIGGWTGPGNLHIATYSERPAIPQITEHEITEPGIGPPLKSEGKVGFVRELDVDLMLTRDRAMELRDWLTERLEEFDRLSREAMK